MKRLSIVLFLIFSASSIAIAQFPRTLLKQVSQIKLLESNRDDVKRILAEYNSTDDDDNYYQEFSMGDVEIEVTYTSGTCSDDSENDEDSEMWKVAAWKVARIEVNPGVAITLDNAGFDLSKFTKEQRYPNDSDSFVFHDKALGLAFKTTEEGIEKIIFLPPRSKNTQLCPDGAAIKDFYSRKGWFSKQKPYDFVCILVNQHSNVVDLDLAVTEIEATSNKAIPVITTAVDPENDVLTYNYKVTGGQIRGTGAKVIWDLNGVAPGTYTITAGVDDGAGIVGTTITKAVIVK
jgi:hypothetical protein